MIGGDGAPLAEKANDANNLSQFADNEMKPVAPVSQPPPADNLEIIIRPIDGEWVMGEDWVISVHKDFTMLDLKNYIHKERGISPFRQQLRLKNGKLVQESKMQWSIRRHGLGNGYILKVEPTLSNSKQF